MKGWIAIAVVVILNILGLTLLVIDGKELKDCSQVLLSVDHMEIEGYTKVYSNPEKDIALYIFEEYEPDLPMENTKVIVDGVIDAVLTSADGCNFYIEVDDPGDIHYGLSGTKVTTEDGKELGFVQSSVSSNTLKCYAY